MKVLVGSFRVRKDLEVFFRPYCSVTILALDMSAVSFVMKLRRMDDPLRGQPIAILEVATVSVKQSAHLGERQLGRERRLDFPCDAGVFAGLAALGLVPEALYACIPVHGTFREKSAAPGVGERLPGPLIVHVAAPDVRSPGDGTRGLAAGQRGDGKMACSVSHAEGDQAPARI